MDKICPGRVKQRERLGPYTTIQIGGRADWFIQPQTISEMKKLLEVAKAQNIPWFVLGQGSNLLVSDRGVRGIVIQCSSPRKPKTVKRFKDGQILMEVEAGFPLSKLVGFGIKNQLRGLEFLAGIPGSVGGAWAMNAGSYGQEMKDITAYLKVVSSEGRLIRKGKNTTLLRLSNFEVGTRRNHHGRGHQAVFRGRGEYSKRNSKALDSKKSHPTVGPTELRIGFQKSPGRLCRTAD